MHKGKNVKIGSERHIYLIGIDRKICLYVQNHMVQIQVTVVFPLQDLIPLPVLR